MQITTGNNLKLLMIKWKLKTASVKPEQNPNPVWGMSTMLRPQPKNNGIEIPKKLQPDLREEVLYHVSLFIMNSAFNISSSSGTLFIMYKYWTARDSNYKFIDFLEQKKIVYKLKLFIMGVSWQLPMLLIALAWYLIMPGMEGVYSKCKEACLH